METTFLLEEQLIEIIRENFTASEIQSLIDNLPHIDFGNILNRAATDESLEMGDPLNVAA